MRSLLNETECNALMRRAEERCMIDISTNSRDCLRVELNETALSERVFRRLLPHIPEVVDIGGPGEPRLPGIKPGSAMQGRWKAVGCNPHWRVCKYPGDGKGHFGPHRDGEYAYNSERRTLLTVNGYLNALPLGFGGATRFLREDIPLTKDEQGRDIAPPGSVTHRVHPDTPGMATVLA